ncbi:hypothetical protein VHEMI06636 [[Torrubiella] hemipterigena]|uniref:Alginate lyase 2 domain-containing protein n=1 Tax=[Torrubiella] hemipterigena TaxID=1531966 RepID=A0A0A1TJX2_9HYPO|nr:hypothetical protein VHEMI06636 [[Torrubiella] hemipterigena]
MRFSSAIVLSSAALGYALDAKCAPGGNFDLTKFTLQEPVGEDKHPKQVGGDKLKGCKGYSDEWFKTDSNDGTMVMKVPESSKCVTTQNSKHCRSELRENGSWSPSASANRLFAEVQVTKNEGEICVGQIHVDDSVSHKPVAELYLSHTGDLNFGVQECATNDCTQKREPAGKVGANSKFTYEIRYEHGNLSVSINGANFKQFSTHKLNNPKSYFKAGNYNQGTKASEVHFSQLRITH